MDMLYIKGTISYYETNLFSNSSDCQISITANNSQCHNNRIINQKRHLLASRIDSKPIRSQKASFSVEAAVVLPVMICALVFVMIFFRILAIQWGINVGSTDLARQAAIYGDELDEKIGEASLSALGHVKVYEANVPVKFINLGNTGISFMGTQVTERDVDIVAMYSVDVPIRIFGKKTFYIGQRAKTKRWVGYDPKEESEGDEVYVYVTKTGTAYHKDIGCTYLSPSVKATTLSDVASKRNEGGGKYYPCERCKSHAGTVVYLTDYGRVYHSDASCSSLSRSINRIRLDDAKGYHACSKCGG